MDWVYGFYNRNRNISPFRAHRREKQCSGRFTIKTNNVSLCRYRPRMAEGPSYETEFDPTRRSTGGITGPNWNPVFAGPFRRNVENNPEIVYDPVANAHLECLRKSLQSPIQFHRNSKLQAQAIKEEQQAAQRAYQALAQWYTILTHKEQFTWYKSGGSNNAAKDALATRTDHVNRLSFIIDQTAILKDNTKNW